MDCDSGRKGGYCIAIIFYILFAHIRPCLFFLFMFSVLANGSLHLDQSTEKAHITRYWCSRSLPRDLYDSYALARSRNTIMLFSMTFPNAISYANVSYSNTLQSRWRNPQDPLPVGTPATKITAIKVTATEITVGATIDILGRGMTRIWRGMGERPLDLSSNWTISLKGPRTIAIAKKRLQRL